MKQKIKIFIIIMVLIFTFMNEFTKTQYDLNLPQFIEKSRPLNATERKWLEDHPVIVYGADENSPPLRYVDRETNQFKGISVDIIQALSIELGVEIKIKPLVFNDSISSLEVGRTDICDLFPSQDRGRKFLFSDKVYYLRGAILVSDENEEIKTYLDLYNKKVATPEGDFAVEFLKKKVGKLNFTFTNNIEEAIKLLGKGEVDAVVGDEPVIASFLEKLKLQGDMKILDETPYENGVVLAVPKNNGILLDILNKGILGIKKKKVVEKIQQKWFGISAPIAFGRTSQKIMYYLFIGIFILIAIFYILYIWNNKLKKEVTKRTKELIISRNELQTTFDGITYFMIIVDKNFNIVNVNSSFLNFAKVEKENLIGLNLSRFQGLVCDENLIEHIVKKTFDEGKEIKKEIEFENTIYEIDTFPLNDEKEEIIKVIISIKDITEKKINEIKLLQASKMVAVGQLAAGVAHEIRNPIGLIKNYSYILKKEVGKLNIQNERIDKSIATIENSVQGASNIITNLLNFSRISDRKNHEIDIEQFILRIIDLEKKISEKCNINICTDIQKGITCNINEEALKHIVINLVSNSIDAMPEGGTLKIKCFKEDNNMYIVVEDTGIGISEKNLNNIFNPFFTTKLPGKGTGLGLYIVYNEVQKLGGNINVESSLGQGTRFTIAIPCLKEDNK